MYVFILLRLFQIHYILKKVIPIYKCNTFIGNSEISEEYKGKKTPYKMSPGITLKFWDHQGNRKDTEVTAKSPGF